MDQKPEIIIAPLSEPSVAEQAVEMVERKGLGHPDTLCDRAAEALSVALSREYLARGGRILHHNVDKAVLCGGAVEVRFGGGEVKRPMLLLHVGRATTSARGEDFDVHRIAVESTRKSFARSLRHLDVERHLHVESLIRPTSSALADLFARGEGVALANDTSMGCGYAPLGPAERLVLAIEAYLTDPATLARLPHLGEDVKVLAVRVRERIELTLAAAFIAAHVRSAEQYLELKEALAVEVLERGRQVTERLAAVTVNAADDVANGQVYLTVTGTSAEAGDDGQVGRGNRANGLITPSRPMTLEAVAGKNPVSHVGKLYNAWAHRIAAEIARRPDVAEVVCQLASRIGAPITQPRVVYLGVRGRGALDEGALRREVVLGLESLPELWRELIEERTRLF